MISNTFTFLKKGSQNSDAIFVSIGFALPFFLFCFRTALWYYDLYIVFDPLYGSSKYNRVLEALFFCYIPTFLIFCFISEKKSEFYSNLYRKLPYLFYYLQNLGSIEVFVFRNLVLAFLVITCSLFFHLFLLWTDSGFLHLRIILLFPYFSFSLYLRQDFLEKHGPVIINYQELYKLRKELTDTVRISFALSVFYLVLTIILYRLDLSMKEDIELLDYRCTHYLEVINEKVGESNNENRIEKLEELKKRKEEVFSSIEKKRLFYKASLRIFGTFQKPEFEKVWDQIQNFYDTFY